MKQFDFSVLPRVDSTAEMRCADIRTRHEHFRVEEQLPFEPDGVGGHVWLKIKKRGINTNWLAAEIARFAKVPQVAVGYAGLKDRHAVTTQWFSINLEGCREPDWSLFENHDVQIVESTRHGKKLKRGVLSGNSFILRLTNLKGDKAQWSSALSQVQSEGVPNYFAEQRFGYDCANLHQADRWFTTGKSLGKRNQRSIYLSAARSWLFNLVLAERIRQGIWNQALEGDVMLLSGTKASTFYVDIIETDIKTRVDMMDIHPTGPLWGQGKPTVQNKALQLEYAILHNWQTWLRGLEKARLSQARRSLRLSASDFSWKFLDDNELELRFFLPAGSYATAIIRELAVIRDIKHWN